jgi:hypothetical protein
MNKKEIKRREEKEENNKKKRSKNYKKRKKGDLIFHSLFSLHVVHWKEKSL